jgi:hypothetical protein
MRSADHRARRTVRSINRIDEVSETGRSGHDLQGLPDMGSGGDPADGWFSAEGGVAWLSDVAAQ